MRCTRKLRCGCVLPQLALQLASLRVQMGAEHALQFGAPAFAWWSEQGAYRNSDNAIPVHQHSLFHSKRWNNLLFLHVIGTGRKRTEMQTAIDKVMYAYTLIAHLTPDQAKATRDGRVAPLAGIDADENVLAVEGMHHLRGADRIARQREPKIQRRPMLNRELLRAADRGRTAFCRNVVIDGAGSTFVPDMRIMFMPGCFLRA